MPRGNSGRIVLEIDSELKQELYETLGKDGMSLKKWFLGQARDYLSTRGQLKLALGLENKNNITNGKEARCNLIPQRPPSFD